MNEPRPDFSHMRPLLLAMARERSVEGVLELVVARLIEVHNIALVRVWLTSPLRPCPVCAQAVCAQVTARFGSEACLHPVQVRADPQLALLDEDARRIPREHLRLQSAKSGALFDLEALGTRPEWSFAPALGCQGAARQPLVFRGATLGLLEVATWPAVAPEGPEWLRVIADHAAAALANSIAFAEIEELQSRLAAENKDLRRELREIRPASDVIGDAPALRQALREVELAAPSEATVLVLGESGTGKELIASEIHRQSERAEHPLIKVNCASIPQNLYESEFFGHVRGAFTGAQRDRAGRFELADGGTLFLDEIGELPLDMQSKLLRVLQDGSYERVGDERTRTADVRLVAATNRDLEEEVAAGRFREDLYYRINVVPIRVPALRDRLEDIPALAEHFLHRSGARSRSQPVLTERALAELLAHTWPGNVRELQNAIERAVILAVDGQLSFAFLRGAAAASNAVAHQDELTPFGSGRVLRASELGRIELENLKRALKKADGRISGAGGAAELLGLNPNTLSSRVRRLEQRLAPSSQGPTPNQDAGYPPNAHPRLC